jgi:polyhydroxybutyrate depolymerase
MKWHWLIRIVVGLLVLIIVLLVLLSGFIVLYARQTHSVPAETAYREIQVDGTTRSYLLHVPGSYDPAMPVPLILSIHGFADWPAHQMEMTRWNDLADQYGFLVAYPRGTGFPLHWVTGAFGTANDPTGEIDFIRALIGRVNADYPLDPARIYVNGLSNGGGMSYMLACTMADTFAAFGGVAGAYLYPEEDCLPARPVPAILFHGTADPIVPYTGGPSNSFGYPFPDVADFARGWAERDGCNLPPESIPARGDTDGMRYGGCSEDAEVVFYTIHGGGHTWPGGVALPEFITGRTTQDIDATRLMWEFFLRHPLADKIAAPE